MIGMSFPTLEQYNEAFQHPQTALLDSELKNGEISTSGLGLPLALCGGFALTYTVKTGRSKYAVRCFHKESSALEQRYIAISNHLKLLRSKYFLDFEFQAQGVRVNGDAFPVVKMAWASGYTLGEFVEGAYRSKNKLLQLNSSLQDLSTYLEGQNLAHGDIQPGNVMVSNEGQSIQLIDYDGMFVDALKILGSAELGHRNFQHPGRTASAWDPKLDRFSFITLNLALRAIAAYPDLWNKTQSDGDSFLFKANDFADPARSVIFSDLFERSQFADDAKNFAAVCKASFDKIPTLEDFLARKNIPKIAIIFPSTSSAASAKYMSAFPVLDATNYALCFRHVGDRVELIGKIVEVKQAITRHGKPYIFINFGPWRGKIVKISIWSEGVSTLTQYPDKTWIGRWVSVVGLMEPPYRSKKYKYSHLAISVTQAGQFHVVTEKEAKYRLNNHIADSSKSGTRINNKEILDGICGHSNSSPRASTTVRPIQSPNQAILDKMKGGSSVPSRHKQRRSAGYYSPSAVPGKKSSTSDNCFIATAIYGSDALETNTLRVWRDNVLMQSMAGRLLVNCYYALSPRVIPTIKRSKLISAFFRTILNRLIFCLNQRR